MQLLLELNEAVIALLGEGDVPQNGGHGVGPHCCGLHQTEIGQNPKRLKI